MGIWECLQGEGGAPPTTARRFPRANLCICLYNANAPKMPGMMNTTARPYIVQIGSKQALVVTVVSGVRSKYSRVILLIASCLLVLDASAES